MISTVTGNYFDGLSAKPVVVQITFDAHELSVFSAEENISKRVELSDLKHIRSIGKDRLIINFNEDSSEGIDISRQGIVDEFIRVYPEISNRNFLLKVKGISNRMILLLLAALLALVLSIYFFAVPFMGEMASHLVSKENEADLGETIYKNMIGTYRVDSTKTKLVNDIVKEVDFLTGYDIKITVVDFNEKNAFALPGGKIVVYSGILDEMGDKSELLGLLSHEVSHVNHQHSLKSMFRSLSSYIFISVIFSDVNGISTVLIENANKFKTLSYSRKLEEEADKEGLKILYHNHIDPYGMVRLFKILLKEGNPVNDKLEFLSSHPLTKKRIEYIEKQIGKSHYTVVENSRIDSLWIALKADY